MSNDTERLFWESIKDSTDKADFDAYLRQFPTGVFASLARNRIAVIVASEQAVTPTPQRTETALLVPVPPALSGGERREAQIALRRLGLYQGTIDGLFGPGTRAGIIAFQRSIGVAADGTLTDAQLVRLRSEAASVTALAAETVATGSSSAGAVPAPQTATPIVEAVPPVAIVEAAPQVAILTPPPPVGSYGAIATGNGPNPVRRGICKNQPSQAEADACALQECGRQCEIRARTGAGQCLAFIESREWGGGEGYGVGDSWDDAVEEAKIGCFRDAGRNYTCELIESACNN